MFPLYINEVIESLADPPELPAHCRILWINRASDRVVLMALLVEPKQPFEVSLAMVEQWLRVGMAKVIQVQPPAYMVRTDISEAARAFRDKNWERIAPLVLNEAIFAPGAMGPLVAARAAELSVPRKTLYRLLYRYWLYGQVRDALLPNYEQSGAPGKAKRFGGGKRGGREARYLGATLESPRQALSDADKACIKVGYGLYKNNAVKIHPACIY